MEEDSVVVKVNLRMIYISLTLKGYILMDNVRKA